MTNKPIKAKPSFYAHCFYVLKEIALKYGYNLVLHGSMDRDLDLIAIPWNEEIGSHDEMVEEFIKEIGGTLMFANGVDRKNMPDADFRKFKVTHHGRIQYVINLNRECKMINDEWVDPQYYIDISVIPNYKPKLEAEDVYKLYIEENTKGWDDEMREKYLYDVEQAAKIYMQGWEDCKNFK